MVTPLSPKTDENENVFRQTAVQVAGRLAVNLRLSQLASQGVPRSGHDRVMFLIVLKDLFRHTSTGLLRCSTYLNIEIDLRHFWYLN